MSDSGEKKRPNAKYRLSYENERPEGITYHYNRETRLEKAPQAVRDLYKVEPKKRFGLFRTLTGSKPRAILFYTIIVMCLIIYMFSRFGLLGSTHNLGGNEISIQAIQYEETVIMALRKSVRRTAVSFFNQAYTGAVTIVVMPAEDAQAEIAFYHRIFFTDNDEEQFSFAVPFNDVELLVAFETERDRLIVRVSPQ